MGSKRSGWIIHYISEYVLEACARFEEELRIPDLHSKVEDSYGEQYVISVVITTTDYCKGVRMFFDESELQTKSLKEIGEICDISLEGGYLAIESAVNGGHTQMRPSFARSWGEQRTAFTEERRNRKRGK